MKDTVFVVGGVALVAAVLYFMYENNQAQQNALLLPTSQPSTLDDILSNLNAAPGFVSDVASSISGFKSAFTGIGSPSTPPSAANQPGLLDTGYNSPDVTDTPYVNQGPIDTSNDPGLIDSSLYSNDPGLLTTSTDISLDA